MIKIIPLTLSILLATLLNLSAEPLKNASVLPDVSLKSSDGQEVALKDIIDGKPSVLVLFRGSWCPYCVNHLKDIQTSYEAIQALGYQVIAISPDRPSKVADMLKRFKLSFPVLSDSPMALAQAFDTHFQLDEETREIYKGYNIDLEEASGLNHYLLPQPSVYFVDASGHITFSHVHPDYTVRMSAKEILEKLKQE